MRVPVPVTVTVTVVVAVTVVVNVVGGSLMVRSPTGGLVESSRVDTPDLHGAMYSALGSETSKYNLSWGRPPQGAGDPAISILLCLSTTSPVRCGNVKR